MQLSDPYIWRLYKGSVFAALSGVFYCLAAVLVKEVTNLHPGQLNIYRFLGLFIFSLPRVVKRGESLLCPKELRWIIFLRGLLGATQSYLGYIAFRYLPIGEASVILFSIPASVTIAARIFLKEPCGVLQMITVISTLIGIIFIVKIPSYLSGNAVVYSPDFVNGLLAALGSLFFNTWQIIVLRKLKSVHSSIILFHMGWIALVETVSLTALFGHFKWNICGLFSLYAILIGFLSFLAQTLVTIALQCETASAVSTLRSGADIILSFLMQTYFFYDVPDVYSIIGAVLVGFSFVFIGMNKWMEDLPQDSPKWKYLKCMLISL